MSILKYPSNGLNNVCKEDLSSCNSMLIGAANNLAYTVPSGFNYSTYMNDLKTTVNGYKEDMKSLGVAVDGYAKFLQNDTILLLWLIY